MTYPASVALGGLQAVFDLPASVGPRTPPTLTPGTNPGSLPAGASISGSGPSLSVYITAPATLSGWDFSGYNIYADGSGLITFNDCIHVPPTLGYFALAIGVNSGAPTVIANYCNFNGLGSGTTFAAMVKVAAGTFTYSYCLLQKPPSWQMDCEGVAHGSYSYFTAPGISPAAGAHLEQIHFLGGVGHTLDHCLFDFQALGPPTAGAPTAQLFWEAFVSSVGASITYSIIRGVAASSGNYALVIGNHGFTATVDASYNVVQKGTSDYWSAGAGAVFTHAFNIDYDTAAYIEGAPPPAPPGPPQPPPTTSHTLQVVGTQLIKGVLYTLIKIRPVNRKKVRVYAEPSGTVLYEGYAKLKAIPVLLVAGQTLYMIDI